MNKTESNKFEFEKKPGYIQRGVVALRDAEGNFLPAVPFYEKITPAIKKGEQQLVKDAAELFAEIIEKFEESR